MKQMTVWLLTILICMVLSFAWGFVIGKHSHPYQTQTFQFTPGSGIRFTTNGSNVAIELNTVTFDGHTLRAVKE